jgi:hypothetical protein
MTVEIRVGGGWLTLVVPGAARGERRRLDEAAVVQLKRLRRPTGRCSGSGRRRRSFWRWSCSRPTYRHLFAGFRALLIPR